MSYAVCRMQKVNSAGLKGMQFHNQRERESRTNEDIDRERTHENYDLQNDENINYKESVKYIQLQNKRERESRKNEDNDRERTQENYDLQNDENINYNERVKDIIDSQKTGTRKTRKDAVLVNELLVTSDRDFFERLDPG